MAVHTGDSTAALDQLRVLEEEGVDSSAWIWVHAKQEEGSGALFDVARRGGWVEFDSVGPGKIDSNVSLVLAMRERRLLGRVLLSQDAGWYHVGEPGGGDFRSFAAFFVDFLPALRKAGLTEAEVRQLTVDNPCEAFSIRVRRT
jgi:phosphotriesterase-related protein